MFDVGFWELALIAVIALLVVGPQRLPALARTVGLYVGKFRRYADHVRREIEREVHATEVKELLDTPAPLEAIHGAVDDTRRAIAETGEVLKSVEDAAVETARTEDDDLKSAFAQAGDSIASGAGEPPALAQADPAEGAAAQTAPQAPAEREPDKG